MKNSTEAMIREWWDYDLPEKNTVDFMERDALWMQIGANAS